MLYNCHTHTKRSHDSSAELEDIVIEALDAGLSGVVFTDHCDCEYHKSVDIIKQFKLCEKDVLRAKKRFGGSIELMFGIELGDPLYAPEFASEITSAHSYDAVLLSIHASRVKNFETPFSVIDFSKLEDEFINLYLKQYFDDMLESVKTFDFDILSHLTVPLRYIELVYGRKTDIKKHYPAIETILREIIKRHKTLEINTASVEKGREVFFPDEKIIDMYLSLGGKDFSLGSDSHTAKGVSKGLKEAAELLRSKGIDEGVYYKNRKKIEYSLKG